jgi:hypothetical protein
VLHWFCVVCMHVWLLMQQAPKTSSAQLMFWQVVPTPKNAPPLGTHSQAYVVMQFTWLKQHAPKPHGCDDGGHGLGVQVWPVTGVHPVGQPVAPKGWQLPVAGSQQTCDGPHGLLGMHVVPAGCTVPPECTQKLGSVRKHRPQQQHACVGWLHTGLGLHGVAPRKMPLNPVQMLWLVVTHPPGRQHAPNCVAELQLKGVQVVPTP